MSILQFYIGWSKHRKLKRRERTFLSFNAPLTRLSLSIYFFLSFYFKILFSLFFLLRWYKNKREKNLNWKEWNILDCEINLTILHNKFISTLEWTQNSKLLNKKNHNNNYYNFLLLFFYRKFFFSQLSDVKKTEKFS